MRVRILLAVVLGSGYILAQQNSDTVARMSIPGVHGVLQLDLGPTRFQTRLRPDGKEVQLRAFDRPDHLAITVFLQRVEFPASPQKCRDAWWPGTKKALAIQRDHLQDSILKDGIARVEYIVPEFQGIPIRQKNIHAYLGSGDLCAEIHMSKPDFKPGDEELFDQVLSSAKLLPDEAPGKSSEQAGAQDEDAQRYFGEGSRLYLQPNYPAAAVQYQKALDLEKKKRTLSKDYFRVLVDNLGMSYGISGNLSQAKATFEYGITQDPEYPLFYYNLACVYGEMNKMDESLEQLRIAYKYKSNMIAGEPFPDPMQDDSFRYFVHNEKFIQAVREMQK